MPTYAQKQNRPLVQKFSSAAGSHSSALHSTTSSKHIQKTDNRSQSSAESVTSPVVDGVLSSSGRSLDPTARSFLESRFGHDFSTVQVHTDDRASDSARVLQAKAFTAGNHVVFGEGQYAPETSSGMSLLAHEMTHVVQQGAAGESKRVNGSFIQRAPAPPPRKTVWINFGFDSSAVANEDTMAKIRQSVAAEKAAIASCCATHSKACDVDIKTRFDWNRVNKPAPADGDYDSDIAADRELRDRNLGNIQGHAGGTKVLVTESSLSQTWEGKRILARANTPSTGVLWNRTLAADDTLAHEFGHVGGYNTGDADSGFHSSDPNNLMGTGRNPGAAPDSGWCEKVAALAQ